MREPERWGKQETAPTLFLFFDLELFILFIHSHSQGEFTGNITIVIRMHIGKLIRQKMEERHKTVVWLAKELAYSRTNVYKIYDKSSIDTDVLLRISIILEYDFFKIYSDEIESKVD